MGDKRPPLPHERLIEAHGGGNYSARMYSDGELAAVHFFETAKERGEWIAAQVKQDPNFNCTISGPWQEQTEKAVMPQLAEER